MALRSTWAFRDGTMQGVDRGLLLDSFHWSNFLALFNEANGDISFDTPLYINIDQEMCEMYEESTCI